MSMLAAPIGDVAKLYRSSQGLGYDGPGEAAFIGREPTQKFSEFLAEGAQEVRTNFQTAEHAYAAGIRGEAGIQEVVTAVMSAKMTLDAVVAVRNRLIDAYQDIMRMPI